MGGTSQQQQTPSKWIQSLWSSLFRQHQPAETTTTPRPLECDANDPLPLVVEEITPQWLSHIFNTQIDDIQIHETLHGSGTKVLLSITLSHPSHPNLPTRLCVKGGFNPQLLELLPSLFAVYRLEAQFYRHIAPKIPGLRLIPSYWEGVDHPSGKGQGIVILKDVKAAGYQFGDPLKTWDVERVRAALAQLARLHAATWGAKQADLPWVPRDFGMRDVITGMMSPENWTSRFADPAIRPPIPETFWNDRDRIVRCLQTLWASAANDKMLCMVHGDTQIGNTFVDGEGRPGFLDWQCVHRNSAAHDVAYFMSGALTVEDRREHERGLFAFYLEELARAGGPKFEVEEVWDEYRKYQMQGFAWALAGPMMQPKEIVDAISARHCAAIIDHQSLELLESLANTKH